jgi:hypothetical protein
MELWGNNWKENNRDWTKSRSVSVSVIYESIRGELRLRQIESCKSSLQPGVFLYNVPYSYKSQARGGKNRTLIWKNLFITIIIITYSVFL